MRAGAHAETLLVLYLGTAEAVDDVAQPRRMRGRSRPRIRIGTVTVSTILDPDGFRVVLVPGHWDGDV